MNTGLKSSSNNKYALYRLWQKSRQKSDEIKYKMYKKVFEKAANATGIKYYKEKFNNRSLNIKEIMATDKLNVQL